MRRTIPVLLTATLLLAACGGSDGRAAENSTSDTTADTTADTATDGTDGADGTTAPAEITTPSTSPDKPTVEIPDEPPEELEITVLTPGEGPPAEEGDTVIVDYIGVRGSDGEEFDNSYDRFESFPVVLGTGGVIQGWDEGLLEAQTGARIQLDIPSDLAYGEQARGEVIGANEALTFIIDVRAVVPPAELADQPTEAGVPESEGATEVTTVDLIEGDGAELEEGQTAVARLVVFRGDTLEIIDSTWGTGALQLEMAEEASLVGLVEGMPGMKVGGRRAIVIPPEQGIGPEGNPEGGLPPDTDIVIVVDLIGVY